MDLNFTENRQITCKFRQARDTPVGQLKLYGKNKKLISSPMNMPPQSPTSHKVRTQPSIEKGPDLRKRV